MNEIDWKQRYEELLTQNESEEAANRELEELLTRTIIRLTLAASGLDARLEPHLKGVRDAVRGGANKQLKEKLNSLSDGLLHFSEDVGVSDKEVSTDYLRLIASLNLSKKEAAEANELLRLLVEDTTSMDDQQFNRLVTLLGRGVAPKEKRTGLFERLLGGSPAEHESGPKPNDILLNLLEQASWPGHWGEAINGLKARLGAAAQADAWAAVLQDLLDLSAKSYGEVQMEIREAEDFLEELTMRLQDLGAHLQSAHDGRDQIVEHGRNLSAKVTGHVGDLGARVQQAVDLHQLKAAVSGRLSLIQHSIDDYLAEEIAWHQQTEESEKQLRDRLEQLEKESNDLRSRMVEAHHLALIDAVTGLPNRLSYEERVEQEYARWKRFDEPLCMLVWDIDDFKSINDRFGHQAGDKALRVIAQGLQARLRVTDFIARYGGEEFVCLLCGTPGEEALRVAEEMRKSVEENGFHSSGKPVPVTISCGIAPFMTGDSIDSVFSRADKALYSAKKSGKNRCELATNS
ncbi:MAG: GGDEF domain-containing protein [Candidatus Thiodiazotropha sp. (ex Dulcina madagascariensis)]|nr:GGDEF domain-containing protein [Candidatus Thiodiazotropha sp. (ex Dulcina madagascariensis)]